MNEAIFELDGWPHYSMLLKLLASPFRAVADAVADLIVPDPPPKCVLRATEPLTAGINQSPQRAAAVGAPPHKSLPKSKPAAALPKTKPAAAKPVSSAKKRRASSQAPPQLKKVKLEPMRSMPRRQARTMSGFYAEANLVNIA